MSTYSRLRTDLTNRVVAETTVDPLKTQQELADAWSSLVPDFPRGNIHVLPSIEHVVRLVRTLELPHADSDGESKSERPVDILVTGSLHLVGGVIEVAGLSEVAL